MRGVGRGSFVPARLGTLSRAIRAVPDSYRAPNRSTSRSQSGRSLWRYRNDRSRNTGPSGPSRRTGRSQQAHRRFPAGLDTLGRTSKNKEHRDRRRPDPTQRVAVGARAGRARLARPRGTRRHPGRVHTPGAGRRRRGARAPGRRVGARDPTAPPRRHRRAGLVRPAPVPRRPAPAAAPRAATRRALRRGRRGRPARRGRPGRLRDRVRGSRHRRCNGGPGRRTRRQRPPPRPARARWRPGARRRRRHSRHGTGGSAVGPGTPNGTTGGGTAGGGTPSSGTGTGTTGAST